jgi:hypothetical protein
MTIEQLMRQCFEQGLDGKQTDTCVKTNAGNLLKPDTPVIAIELDLLDDLLNMMRTADAPHIFVGGGIFHFNALYFVDNNFPASRVYFMKSPYLDEIAKIGLYLQKHGFNLPPTDEKRFLQLIESKGYPERYRCWLDQSEARSKPFKRLLDGRIKNTAVQSGIWLSSGGCLMCGAETDRMFTSTLISDNGMMIGLKLCELHENEVHNHSNIIEYIAKKLGIPVPFFVNMKFVQLTEETIEMSCRAVADELECEIEKIQDNTITALRKSGFRIILRQDALNDYAYNVKDPNGKLVSRIDSAKHHAVDYGPDHVHRDLSKSKKNHVEASFTYGFAVADLQAIRILVEDAEAQWQSCR